MRKNKPSNANTVTRRPASTSGVRPIEDADPDTPCHVCGAALELCRDCGFACAWDPAEACEACQCSHDSKAEG